MKSNFQRAQSKVWWGNYERPYYDNDCDYSSIDHEICTKLQRPEAETPKTPEKPQCPVWGKRQGSPSSHKSQDSGFSDTENSPPLGKVGGQDEPADTTPSLDTFTPKKRISETQSQRSPSTSSEIATPPTVIRRPEYEARLNEAGSVRGRRISYSVPTSPITPPARTSALSSEDNDSILSKINDFSFDTTSPLGSTNSLTGRNESLMSRTMTDDTVSLTGSNNRKGSSLKRSRVITKNSRINRSMLGSLTHGDSKSTNDISNLSPLDANNNETLSFGTPKSILKCGTSYQNETVYLGHCADATTTEQSSSGKVLPTYAELYPTRTSTPIMCHPSHFRSDPVTPTRLSPSNPRMRPCKLVDNFRDESAASAQRTNERIQQMYNFTVYSNGLLNGHPPALQFWLDEARGVCATEVLSVLQTKSVEIGGGGATARLPAVTVVKLIRNLQAKLIDLQREYENVENLFDIYERNFSNLENPNNEIIKIMSSLIQNLVEHVYEFISKLTGAKCGLLWQDKAEDVRRFDENIQNVVDLAADLQRSSSNIFHNDCDVVREEVSLLKRYLLYIVRLVFDKLIGLIASNIEDSGHELLLRANLGYIAMLTSYGLRGLASLNEALTTNGVVRVLLIVCLDNRVAAIRTLALRALATVCSSRDTIQQLHNFDGVEILRHILCDNLEERSDSETREAISVLTQITAPWHSEDVGADAKRTGEMSLRLGDGIGPIAERIVGVLGRTESAETLLLCAACLNNFSRLESIAIYTFIANETILRLQEAIERCGRRVSIFLYEQITTMIGNMLLNKKSHYHLSTRPVIQFLTSIFQAKIRDSYASRQESEALKKTIKNIIHIFVCLVHESAVGKEVLEHNIIPIFSQLETDVTCNSDYIRDITFLNRKFNESMSPSIASPVCPGSNSSSAQSVTPVADQQAQDGGSNNSKRISLSRQVSYV